MVIRAEKDPETLDIDGTLAPDSTSRGIFHRRPQRTQLPPVVGTHPGTKLTGSLLYGLLGSLQTGHSRRAAYPIWQGEWFDRLRRAVEQARSRQRLARFVRKTLSFSKSDRMHEICLRLFLHRYNLSRCPT